MWTRSLRALTLPPGFPQAHNRDEHVWPDPGGAVARQTLAEDFVARVVAAFARVTGGDLVREAGLDPSALGYSAYHGDFALRCHRGDPQAHLNYGNRFALDLWEYDWDNFVGLPSAGTAPDVDRAARDVLMAGVARDGFTRSYSGRRVSRTGRLFLIQNVTVWRLLDAAGPFGVAAFFRHTAST